jgi:hypothetical protein
MGRFVEGVDRRQATLLPECHEDWVNENNPVRAVDVFVEALKLAALGFDGAQPLATGGDGTATTLVFCSSFTSTAISTAYSRAAGWNARRAATWK